MNGATSCHMSCNHLVPLEERGMLNCTIACCSALYRSYLGERFILKLQKQCVKDYHHRQKVDCDVHKVA